MMNPEMMKLAAEQMQRMSPDELARIQQMAASMDPSVMASAARSMQSLRPEEVRMASEQMKQFSPEQLKEMGAGLKNPDDLRRNAAMFEQQTAARRQYEVKAAQKLKAEGNQLISAGKHADATQKYLKAKSNLEGHDSSEAQSLRTSCSLNLLICYLRTGRNEDAVREGSEVLRADANNIKALYRRGQAYKAMGKLQLALTDLRKASQVDPDDDTVRDAAEQVKEALAKQRAEGPESNPPSNGPIVEEPSDDEPTSSATSAGAGPSGALGMPPGFPADSEAVQRSLAMMKDMDPEALKSMHKMMADLSPEVIASMTPGVTPEMARQTQERLKSISPEDFQRQTEFAAKMAGLQNATPSASRPTPSPSSAATSTSSKAGDASASKGKASEAASSSHGDAAKPAKKVIRIDHQRKPGASKPNGKAVVEDGAVESDDEVEEIRTAGAARAEPVVPPSGVRPPNVTPEMLASVQEKLKDPNAMKAMSDMMSAMSPEAMAAMSGSMGMKITPEMAKMAVDSMKHMKPEDMERMTAAMGGSGGASTSGSPFAGFDPSAMGDMQEKMKDPQMMKMAADMMKNLSPEMLQAMGEQAGMKITPEQAEKAAEAMKGLSEKDIQRMMLWAERMQRVGTQAKAARDWLLARPLIILAIMVLFVAVLLRWLGYL